MRGTSQIRGQVSAILVPVALLSAGIGAAGGALGARAMDTTPYEQVDLNTASFEARRTGKAQAQRDAADASAQVNAKLSKSIQSAAKLESTLATTRRKLAREQGATDALERQLAEREERITALEGQVATAQVEPDLGATSDTAIGGQGVTVKGTLESAWILGSELKPWPRGCGGAKVSYQIRIKDGAGATIAIGEIIDAQITERKTKHGILDLVCSMTYSAALDDTSGSAYEFVAIDQAEPEESLDTALVSGSSLRDKRAPELFTSFCPSCPPEFQ